MSSRKLGAAKESTMAIRDSVTNSSISVTPWFDERVMALW